MALGMHVMSKRTSIMLGALTITAAHIISAFATDLRLLFVSIGFLEGLGIALSNPAIIATLGEYFHKRRGLANGLTFSGGSLGGLLFAPIFSTLFTDYGYTGTFLIIAGLTMNILVTSALLRPLKSFERNTQKAEKLKCKTDVLANTAENEKFMPVLNKNLISSSPDKLSGSPLLPRARALSVGNRQAQTVSQGSHKGLSPLNNLVESLSRSRVALYASVDGIYGSITDIRDNEIDDKNDNDECKIPKTTILDKLKASFEVNLFKSPLFPVFLLMAAVLAPTSYLIPLFIAPLANDIGLSADQIGLLMSIVCGVGMFSRVTCALFADKKFMRLTTLLAVVSIMSGITAHCIRLFTSFPLLVFMAVVIGLSTDIYLSMYPVILVEFLTLPKLKTCIGFTILCHGLAVAVTFLVVGSLRDSTGSYYASYHFLGTMSFAGAAFALSLPYLHRRQQENEV
ncbi:monocarboxylate transporter 12-like [Ruditapes philippinarum]|uniref:monocarboxylate transporter 12-like n=1 Tax=Ruditapes philippinarum TaxID=129788 RepID=UPI00295B0CFA|nr:monocarboxylate transporter 12-like [Ruditapes philippinarum]